MIYFLSDAHLGSRVISDPEAHQRRLVRLLEQMAKDAEEIFLLGDMFDFWYEYIFERHQWTDQQGNWHLPSGKQQYLPFVRTLRRLTDQGIKVHYFIGNHDIWTFGDLERNTGVMVHRQPQSFERQGKQLFLAHGDGLVPQDFMSRLPKDIQKRIKRFMHLRAFFHHPLPQFLFRLLPPAWGDAFGYEWARRSRLKELRHPFPYKGDDKEELVLWANEHRQYDFCVFGHRHVVLNLCRVGLPDVIILGDFFQQFTYAQMKDGQIEIKKLTE
ncbi:MAG: UDP-2,3-diacylglucosamine diphosphatase [Paludibacteraceae bacterium]|nr:UDP-2,3-diacylglucosamine diphosphatase [Paludibacteraceae bacterium]